MRSVYINPRDVKLF